MAAYLKYAADYYRKDGRQTSELSGVRYALRYVKTLYGRKRCDEFGPIALQAVRERMVEDGWSRGTINQQVRRITRMFRWGVSQQLIPASIDHALSTVPGLRRGRTEAKESVPVLPVEDSVVEATISHLPAVPADMVRLQRLTGMRPAEVCIMRPCDLDRSGEVWTYRPESHKTQHHGRERVVYVGPQAQAVLLRYLARDAAAYCFRPVDSEAKRRAAQHAARKTPLSCGNRPGTNRRRKPKVSAGERYTTASYRRAISRACDLAFPHPDLGNLKPSQLFPAQLVELRKWQSDHRWAPNQLRHSAATTIRREFGLEAAQVALGHATASVTQVYAERDSKLGIEVARRIG